MSLTKNQVASVAYTLKNAEGQIIDKADKTSPMTFLHGVGGMIPGFEKALEGKAVGDAFSIELEPAEAYGERDDSLTQEVPKNMFEGIPDEQLVPGAQFQAQTNGGIEVITIATVEEDTVKIDGNHPLAGMALFFDVEMLDIREATEEEIAHGHVHATGGCGSSSSGCGSEVCGSGGCS